MSDTYSQVNSVAMAEALSDLSVARGKVQENLDNLTDKIMNIMGSGDPGAAEQGWTGASRDAYNTAQASWTQDLNQMISIIQHMTTTLGSITDNYQVNERAIQGMW